MLHIYHNNRLTLIS